MELAIRIEVQPLPEGFYLATSDELPGLVAQLASCRTWGSGADEGVRPTIPVAA